MIDRQAFFTAVRSSVFGGAMQQVQVDGCEIILAEWDRRKLSDLRWLAYMLATTFHETARTMQPTNEVGGAAYFNRLYGIEGSNPERARRNGNINAGDGARYHGRGYVQLTWRNNYKKMGDLLNLPIEAQPELALDPKNAASIMFEGMIRGMFTGKSLVLYFNDHGAAWIDARQIVNGLDCASAIAGYGIAFFMALRDDGKAVQPKSDIPTPGPMSAPIEPKRSSIFSWAWGKITGASS